MWEVHVDQNLHAGVLSPWPGNVPILGCEHWNTLAFFDQKQKRGSEILEPRFRRIASQWPQYTLEVYAKSPLYDAGVHATTADRIHHAGQLAERRAEQAGVSSPRRLEAGMVERVERFQTDLEVEVLADLRDIGPFDDAQVLVDDVRAIPSVERSVAELSGSREVKARCCPARFAEHRSAGRAVNGNQSRVRVEEEDARGGFKDTELALELTHRHIPQHRALRHIGCTEAAAVWEAP